MTVIRGIIIVIALLAILVGLSQLAFASWWVGAVQTIVYSNWLIVFGALSVFFGGALLIAVAGRVVGLRLFVGIVGVLSFIAGVVLFANRAFMIDITNALILARSEGFQRVVVSVGGIMRITIGALLLYAVRKALAAPAERIPME